MSDDNNDPDHLSRMDYYNLIRGQLEHENELLNQRVIWHVISQSFLIMSYVSLVNAPEKSRSAALDWMHGYLLWIIVIVGMLATVLTLPAIVGAILTISRLRHCYEDYEVPGKASDRFPPINNDHQLRRLSYITPIGLPLLFTITWAGILLLQWLADR